jgi:methylthioribose-1-phosphate isomerase
MKTTPTLQWIGDASGHVEAIDQTLLPMTLRVLRIDTREGMWDAIKRLAIRGAPAIGVAAAFGVVIGMQPHRDATPEELAVRFEELEAYLASARPTAVNLFWALDRMARARALVAGEPAGVQLAALHREAASIFAEDREICDRLGRNGAPLIHDGDRLLTHCNAGALATAGSGTALAVMFAAQAQGKRFEVYVDETRPLLQGARLTTWELMRAGIASTLICDNTAAHVMRTRKIDRIFVGADRIAANGDTANKIGTYGVAVLARAHGVPFYVVAPASTFDLSLADGSAIPIEERDGAEIVESFGCRTAPEGVRTYAPAFDVTPASLIEGIVTERGIISPVTEAQVRSIVKTT